MIDARPDAYLEQAIVRLRAFTEQAQTANEVGAADLWTQAVEAVELAQQLVRRAIKTAPSIGELAVIETLPFHDVMCVAEENVGQFVVERMLNGGPRIAAIALGVREFWGLIRRLHARVEPTTFGGNDTGCVNITLPCGIVPIVGSIDCPTEHLQVLG